jgi:hypothetical protein
MYKPVREMGGDFLLCDTMLLCYSFWMRYAFSGQKSGRGYALLYLEKIFARREAHGYMLGFYAEGMVRMKFERVRNNGLGRGAERQCLGKGW